jgi:16S rRNA U1498 N3-methylase RsmE
MADVVANLPTFITTESFTEGGMIHLGDEAQRHLRVLRLAVGASVGLRDGAGLVGSAKIVRLGKGQAQVEVLS